MSNQGFSNATLGDFLRACRARVNPADVGLPDDGRHRKVPGLRREELAQLANVSVDYVVRLEQGRTANVSATVLESLARALNLQPDERDYLLTVGAPAPRAESGFKTPGTRISPHTQMVIDGLQEFPALVLGRRMDVLGWNAMGTALLADFGALPVPQRNLVRMAFLDPAFRELYDDWAKTARECVAYLRMDAARYPEDKQLAALVGELSVRDEDFRRWWGDHQVRTRARGRKAFRHPVAGPMTLNFQTLILGSQPDQTLFVYTADPGSASQEALRFLVTWAGSDEASSTGKDTLRRS
ncbi:helix-turn-helix transcriptional regulator [Streptomyces sp. NPDC087659]|uniref:helix-turn-helix transcriptional regulator n=1 Tax=Streptomyces sp. NPDC087659 TaxID=3365801 RepID=UPI0037FFF55A